MRSDVRVVYWPARSGIADWTSVGTDGEAFGRAFMAHLQSSNAFSEFRRLHMLSNVELAYGRSMSADAAQEGAKAVEPATYDYAKAFAMAIPRTVPLPDVYSENDGQICFEWYAGPHQVFSVSVAPDGVLYYAGLNGSERLYGSNVFAAAVPEAIRHNIERLVSGDRR
jgi:hypothetical protein